MSEWKEFSVLSQNIKHETAKAVLVQMPHNSDYNGFKFWHPQKITEDDGHRYFLKYTDDFIFRLFKNGKWKHNQREVIDRIDLSAEEVVAAFSRDCPLDEWETHKPEKLEPGKVEVLEELLDD